MQIVLRAFPIKGTDQPAYSMSDSALVLTDRGDGVIRALDGTYSAFYDENTFDSPYTKVEGVARGDLFVTIKAGQPVWPEWTSENTAETIDGTKFVLTDGVWYEEDAELLRVS